MVEISVMQRFLYWGRNMLSLVHYNGACMLILRLGTHSLTHPPTTPTHLNRVIIRAANNVLSATESCRVDRFRVSLKYVHWVNGRSSEVPESKSRILWWGNEQLLSGMGTDMGQLKVVTCVCVRGGGVKWAIASKWLIELHPPCELTTMEWKTIGIITMETMVLSKVICSLIQACVNEMN